MTTPLTRELVVALCRAAVEVRTQVDLLPIDAAEKLVFVLGCAFGRAKELGVTPEQFSEFALRAAQHSKEWTAEAIALLVVGEA